MRRCAVARVRLPQPISSSTAGTRVPGHRYYSAHAQQQKKTHPIASDAYFSAPTTPKPLIRPDPYKLVAPELQQLRETLLDLLGSSHPSLTEIAKYYFLHPSKQLRPLLVLLFSQATNGLGGGWHLKKWAAECEGAGGRAEELDRPLTRPDVLNDWNPSMPDHTASFQSSFSLRPPRPPHQAPTPPPFPPPGIPTVASPLALLPTQVRLAQIVEMIHVASLLHDDVIDRSPLRRGAASAPAAFGNKLSVLAGDFLLGRTSAALSRLGESEVVELIASVIANLVEGEILQLKSVHAEELGIAGLSPSVGQDNWNIYLQKTYLKTASLMAKGARAAVVLGGCKEGEVWKEVAYAYGRNLGIAFQLVDDLLDYEAGEATLGKPGGADLQLGLATGPALFAWEEHPEMGPLIKRKFEQPGDVELARDLVRRSSGVERTRELARAHADKAREVLSVLPDSEAKGALEALTERVVKRTS
ncbi:terpenoid synthase [Polyporus arcularius HHB13444]|uniref:(2E,6E)-farnesyl diphosphate synthase n=1 Tax=Polyporus arcularius HHB13444 TaxID=1314778 RepID=A0A5C3PZD0_9APHY|nr:terpenoid synthase [Polyporus arcularius HHB13444]